MAVIGRAALALIVMVGPVRAEPLAPIGSGVVSDWFRACAEIIPKHLLLSTGMQLRCVVDAMKYCEIARRNDPDNSCPADLEAEFTRQNEAMIPELQAITPRSSFAKRSVDRALRVLTGQETAEELSDRSPCPDELSEVQCSLLKLSGDWLQGRSALGFGP